MPPRKCKICNKPILKEEYENNCMPYKAGYIHIDPCFNISLKLIQEDKKEKIKKKAEESKTKKKAAPKPKIELKGPVSEEEYKEKKDLYEYIRSYYETEDGKLPAKVYALVEKYIEQYGFTYTSIRNTLIYIREICEKDIQGDGIGLLPYYKDEAEAYYKSLKEIEENNKNININDMYKEKTIIIQPRKRIFKQLDITNIK